MIFLKLYYGRWNLSITKRTGFDKKEKNVILMSIECIINQCCMFFLFYSSQGTGHMILVFFLSNFVGSPSPCLLS